MKPLNIPALGYTAKSNQSPYTLVSPRFETLVKSEFESARRLNGEISQTVDSDFPLSARNTQESSTIKVLFDVKRKKKVMEHTVDLLNNRLAALAVEQKRMDQQVLGIKKKSEELLVKRIEHEKRMKEKKVHEEKKLKKEKSTQKIQDLIRTARTKKLNDIQKLRETLSEEKLKDMARIKEEKFKNLERVHQKKQESLDSARLLYLKAKEEEKQRAEKKKAQLEIKTALLKQERQRSIEKEQEVVKKREREIKNLVEREAKMLDALNNIGNSELLAKRAYTEISELPLKEALLRYSVYLPQKTPTKPKIKSPTKPIKLAKLNLEESSPLVVPIIPNDNREDNPESSPLGIPVIPNDNPENNPDNSPSADPVIPNDKPESNPENSPVVPTENPEDNLDKPEELRVGEN